MLRLEIHKDRSTSVLGLSHKTYIHRVIKRFVIHNCSSGEAHIVKGDKFSNPSVLRMRSWRIIDDANLILPLLKVYYMHLCNRPHIAYMVSVKSRVRTLKDSKVMRYLHITKDFILYLVVIIIFVLFGAQFKISK